jgi:hypothetical protein
MLDDIPIVDVVLDDIPIADVVLDDIPIVDVELIVDVILLGSAHLHPPNAAQLVLS